MPFNATTKVFQRIWKFVDQFSASEEVRRVNLDTALDDISDGVNETSAYLKGLIDNIVNSELYLGPRATAPTEGVGGAALVAGNFYAKTPDYIFFVYNGITWVSTSDLPPASDYFKTLPVATNAEAMRGLLELGSAAEQNTEVFATAAQGTKADQALPSSTVTTAGNALITGANAAAQRTSLGLGDVAVRDMASEAEAQAGASNTVVMSPLRVVQAIVEASLHPKATSTAGVGQIAILSSTTLPADGTWFYFAIGFTTGNDVAHTAGIQAGGSSFSMGGAVVRGFAWRVS